MELSFDSVNCTVLPTAAFLPPLQPPTSNVTEAVSWEESQTNILNRIDSLEPVKFPKWRIDGCCGMGTQFYTIPIFLPHLIPMRIDTFIPKQTEIAADLHDILQVNRAFHLHDSRVAFLGISRFILRVLELWVLEIPSFGTFYESLPFGSRILLENISRNVRNVRVSVVRTHNLEKQLLSLSSLCSMWGIPESSCPPTIALQKTRFLKQLHDSVCLIEISLGCKNETYSRVTTLKALTSFPKYLYHELRVLLFMPPHPNIIKRPLYLVTKKCGFGSKVAVVGFTTEYQPFGVLQDKLPILLQTQQLTISIRLKWALQLTEALLYIREKGETFYSDLRLENVVLSQSKDVIMVDFEQRGVWSEFLPPEISYLSYIHALASSNEIPLEVQQKYKILSETYMQLQTPQIGSEIYNNPDKGYYTPWICLTPEEQEAGEVYMLGRALWCIFEGVSAPEPSVWVSYRRESELEFPRYRRTPLGIRRIIDCATRGRKGSEDMFPVVRRGDELVLREEDPSSYKRNEFELSVQETARRWWINELEEAERFLAKRGKFMDGGRNWFERPRLAEVRDMLRSYHSRWI